MSVKFFELMPRKYVALANYNTEVAHGLVHTDEWKTQMAKLQAEYNVWVREDTRRYSEGREQQGRWWRWVAPELWKSTR